MADPLERRAEDAWEWTIQVQGAMPVPDSYAMPAIVLEMRLQRLIESLKTYVSVRGELERDVDALLGACHKFDPTACKAGPLQPEVINRYGVGA